MTDDYQCLPDTVSLLPVESLATFLTASARGPASFRAARLTPFFLFPPWPRLRARRRLPQSKSVRDPSFHLKAATNLRITLRHSPANTTRDEAGCKHDPYALPANYHSRRFKPSRICRRCKFNTDCEWQYCGSCCRLKYTDQETNFRVRPGAWSRNHAV